MNGRLLCTLAPILCGGLAGCSRVSPTNNSLEKEIPPVTLGYALFENVIPARQTNHCQLSFIWLEGNHTMHDAELWCGDGEKYSGKFIFRVQSGDGSVVETPVESLYPDGEFEFVFAEKEQPWEIKMADYNNDGQPDFNIVTYGSCNYSTCSLFTVCASGEVEALKLEGTGSLTMNRTDMRSTDEFKANLTPAGFYYEFYDRQNSTLNVESFDWDAQQKIFHVRNYAIQTRR